MPLILLLAGDGAPWTPRRRVAHRARWIRLFVRCSSRSRTLLMRVDRERRPDPMGNLESGIRIPVRGRDTFKSPMMQIGWIDAEGT